MSEALKLWLQEDKKDIEDIKVKGLFLIEFD